MTKRPKATERLPKARQPTRVDVEIGQLIRQRRVTLGLSRGELARRLGIAQSQLQKYEQGDNRISASRLVECSQVLSVPIGWFFQLTPQAEGLGPRTDIHSDLQSLLDAYQELSPEARTQLVDIAQVLRTGKRRKPA